MAESPPLQLGWQLIEAAGPDRPRARAHLAGAGLLAHTAVIAQSGSGKSFALSRLIEELAAKTSARLIVLDPNGDFCRIGEVAPEAWASPKLAEWFDSADTYDAFAQRWERVGVTYATNRLRPGKVIPGEWLPITLPWRELSFVEKLRTLGFDIESYPMEAYAVQQTLRIEEASIAKQPQLRAEEPLSLFARCASRLWAEAMPHYYEPREEREEELTLPTQFDAREVSDNAAFRVHAASSELRMLNVWGRAGSGVTLPQLVKDCLSNSARRKIVVLDLPSLETVKERVLATEAVLSEIWRTARDRWASAVRASPAPDRRLPTFVVIDEAHNLVPSEVEEGVQAATREMLLRFATEGRKYGIFLIVVTQRPTRLHPLILAQCENLLLMRLNSERDVTAVEEVFGFLPPSLANRALRFGIGDALACGRFVAQPMLLHVSPKRTREGGGNLEPAVFLTDPLQP